LRGENICKELKREFTPEIKKTAVAFANSKGGKIYIGIGDDGEVIGVESASEVSRQAASSVRDSIKPDITPFLDVRVEIIDGKEVVVVTIARGDNAPYYLAERGLKPSGVYIRVGEASVPATTEHIRQLIKLSDGDKFIVARSMIQDLTFESAKEEFDKREIAFTDANKKSLGIIDENDMFTNLGLLLSDQCQHTVKVGIFEGKTKTVFKSRKEFAGSLIKQLNDTLEYIDYFNLIHASVGKVRRVESRDYSALAIRESVLNALVHREYGLSASAFVNVYDDRMEFLSVGGLAPGISIDAVMSGVSLSRNEGLANIFYRLKLVEAYGTGIMRIFDDYAEYKRKPEIQITDSSFMMVLPNKRYDPGKAIPKNEQEWEVFRLIELDGAVSAAKLAKRLGVGKTRSYYILSKMVDDGKLIKVRNGRRINYVLFNSKRDDH
jgi:ATP-dependent DNA helicase RecG